MDSYIGYVSTQQSFDETFLIHPIDDIRRKRQMGYMNWIYLYIPIDCFQMPRETKIMLFFYFISLILVLLLLQQKARVIGRKNSDKFSVGCKQMPDKNDLLSAGYCSPKQQFPNRSYRSCVYCVLWLLCASDPFFYFIFHSLSLSFFQYSYSAINLFSFNF